MQISSISGRTAFKAQVNSQSPLISGNWQYLQGQSEQIQTEPKKNGFWKKAFLTLATLGVVAGALAWGRNKIPADIMNKTFKTTEGFTEKALYTIGKCGDYVKAGWAKLVSFLPKAKEAVEEGTEKMTVNASDIPEDMRKAAGI